jgi:rubrerythrin
VTVASRLRTLERRAGAEARQQALCGVCGGLGRYNARTFTNGVPARDEPPEPCPGCGTVRLVQGRVSHGRSIAGRVLALERQAHERGSCRVCGGEGAAGLVFQFEGEQPPWEPEPCPGCGKSAPTRFLIVEAVGGGAGS